jgi:hypothetical protein
MAVKMSVFWVVTLCGFLGRQQRFIQKTDTDKRFIQKTNADKVVQINPVKTYFFVNYINLVQFNFPDFLSKMLGLKPLTFYKQTECMAL